MDTSSQLVIAGVVITPILTGLGQGYKKFGMAAKYVWLTNILVGIAISLIWTLVNPPYSPAQLFAAIIIGISEGLGSAKVYDRATGQ